MLVLLAVIALAAGAVQLLSGRREEGGRAKLGRLALPTWAIGLGIAAVLGAGGLAFVATSGEQIKGADAARLRSVDSNRYAYWRIAVDTFTAHPVAGVGSGGFGTEWVRERKLPEFVRDAHSATSRPPAELGILGLLALGLFGVGVVAVRGGRGGGTRRWPRGRCHAGRGVGFAARSTGTGRCRRSRCPRSRGRGADRPVGRLPGGAHRVQLAHAAAGPRASAGSESTTRLA